MIGQEIWAYQDHSTTTTPTSTILSPGVISMDVLSEIIATFSILWNNPVLRNNLTSQIECILTGFYQRALALLRKLPIPKDSHVFDSNLIFDSEVEIVLESLVDILTFTTEISHSNNTGRNNGNGKGSLETIFETYDCHKNRANVVSGLIVELCRCCGGTTSDDGESFLNDNSFSTKVSTPPTLSSLHSNSTDMDESNIRPVPAHLRELCAEALIGSLKCLFRHRETSSFQFGKDKDKITTTTTTNNNTPLEHDNDHIETKNENESETKNITSLRNVKHQKNLIQQAAQLFNNKSSAGIQSMVDSGIIQTPLTPKTLASFLRNGIVVGLDKKSIGEYLGMIGKQKVAGKKTPAVWDMDWFHKECLHAYCISFHFNGQGLLDGLRMFLAAFRLPGEAQQIDRILQAFSDSCGLQCEESCNGRLKLFSQDEKKAGDAAYLLSFSIIMLNTDLHNKNIREDRKMTVHDFIKVSLSNKNVCSCVQE